MGKRKAIGKDPLAWIAQNDPPSEEAVSGRAVAVAEIADARPAPEAVPDDGDEAMPKFMTYEVLTARLRGDQIDFLSELERRIMRARTAKGERITKNSLLRAAVDILHMLQFDLRDIPSEDELRKRVLGELRSN